ncbi:MAG: 1,4-alpha-glucan-branching enzyme, partial [Bacteroidales bacterium]
MLWESDPYLEPYKDDIRRRCQKAFTKCQELAGYGNTLNSAVNSHLYYGVHKTLKSWIFREWAPNATALYLIGDVNGWEKNEEYSFKRVEYGNWELELPLEKFKHEDLFKWLICWNGGEGERIPAYATRCIQDHNTKLFTAQIWDPEKYDWRYEQVTNIKNPLIY